MKISRFIWVVAVFAALLIVALALPQDVWASLGSLPAHPLIVHAIIVLVPLLSALIVVGLFVRKMLAVMHLYVLGGLGLVATAVVGAKASGNALAAVVGLPGEHAEWGDILVPLVIALFIAFAVFCVVTYYASVRWLAVTFAVIVGLLAIASSAMTVAVGHSGAESVWQRVWPASSQAPTMAPSPTGDVTPTTQPTATSVPATPANPGITLSQVSQHNTAADCWAVVGESVYDLSGFIEQHPGGPVVVEAMCGTDATSGFMGQHSGEKRPERELASLLVGPLSR
jgi:hypothetical protein